MCDFSGFLWGGNDAHFCLETILIRRWMGGHGEKNTKTNGAGGSQTWIKVHGEKATSTLTQSRTKH